MGRTSRYKSPTSQSADRRHATDRTFPSPLWKKVAKNGIPDTSLRSTPGVPPPTSLPYSPKERRKGLSQEEKSSLFLQIAIEEREAGEQNPLLLPYPYQEIILDFHRCFSTKNETTAKIPIPEKWTHPPQGVSKLSHCDDFFVFWQRQFRTFRKFFGNFYPPPHFHLKHAPRTWNKKTEDVCPPFRNV